MRSASWRMAVAAVLVLLSAGCAARTRQPAVADPAAIDNWAAVMALREGTYVKVDVIDATPVAGPLIAANPSAITARSGSWVWTIPLSRVREVRVVRDKSTRGALLGLICGGVAGGLVGGLVARSHPVLWGVGLATLLGLQGAYVGGSLGMRDRREVIVYVSADKPGDPLHKSVMAGT